MDSRPSIIRKKLRILVNVLLDEVVDEMSSTGNAAGYQTPMAFAGDKPIHKKKVKFTTNRLGYELTKRGAEELEEPADSKEGDPNPPIEPKYPLRMQESVSRYNRFKSDPETTAKQKIGYALRDVKRGLKEMNHQLKIVRKYKNEIGYSSDRYWKHTLKDIYKIEEMLIHMSQKIREIKS